MPRRRISKLLVANRGEITRRIFTTCRTMGIATVAVYSEPDADAAFVREADEAVPLGGSTPAESYLRIDAIADALRRSGADALHPGYGFLSENAELRRRCDALGVCFVGPSAHAIDTMGSKLGARALMEEIGVPVLPGADLTGLDDAATFAAADAVGWPVLVKASFGGGGRGMRIVRDRGDLIGSVAAARREAGSAFGNDTVFIERYVDRPRHVEVQVLGDQHGTIVSLHERECSVQRRHQKIIEEAPSPVVGDVLRAAMSAAAIGAAKAVEYVGAGTVEFLLAPTGEFFFLEMNTRLQVEHAVTEAVTGLDLVRLQLLVAQGHELPPEAIDPPIVGHAIEARLYAEDPAAGFLPAAGLMHRFEIDAEPGIRVDAGIESGTEISTNYDPMLAKVIAHAPSREEAALRLADTLRRSRLHGVSTNRDLLVGILGEAQFLAGAIDTHYLERHRPVDLCGHLDDRRRTVGAVVAVMASAADRRTGALLPHVPSGWRNLASSLQMQRVAIGDDEIEIGYRFGRHPLIEIDGKASNDIEIVTARAQLVDLLDNGVRRRYRVDLIGADAYVDGPDGSIEVRLLDRFPDVVDVRAAGSLLAPMPGTVVRIEVAIGDRVAAGQLLMVVEAMKMEHQITASAAGVVDDLRVAIGQNVGTGDVLAVMSEGTEDVD